VLQSSVLGPIPFLLYSADVLVITARHGVSVRSYADDAQLYLHTPVDNCEATFACLVACIDDIGLWMSSNRLKLNAEKTQFTCLCTKYHLTKVDDSVLVANSTVVDLLSVITCLSVTIDQELTFADHIQRLTGRCFHCLRQLRSVRRMLTSDTITTLVNTLVVSWIDYCNAVIAGVHGIHWRQLQ